MLKYRSLSLVLAALFSLFMAACSSEPDQKSCTSLQDCGDGMRCDESGVCSSEVKSCSSTLECAADEYCGAGTCQPAACSDDAACADGNICVFDTCREGCRPGDSTCGENETCNADTFMCEPVGCTPTSCRSRLQRCDETQSPAVCVFTGACDSDYHCLAYGNQLDDGKNYICNVARGECVEKPPCTEDDDCRIGEICDENAEGENVCRVGCRDNSECRIGELCAHDQGSVCVKGCSSDEQCQVDGDPRAYYCRNLQCVPTCASVDDCSVEGQVCSGSPSFCQGCTDDTQCRSTQFCDFAAGATPEEEAHPSIGLCRDSPPTCPDDGFGANTARESAHVIAQFPFEATGESAAVFCRENTGGDWFAIDVGAGQYIEIDLEYEQEDGNLDVILLRADGSEVVASAYPPDVDGGQEKIRYGVDLGARMYVQVRGAILSTNARYSLRVNVGDAPACVEDALDPNTRDEPMELDASNVYRNLRVCGTSPDYYKISVADNQVVRITAQAPVNMGFINLALYNMDGQLISSSDSRRGAETLYHSTSLAEDFIVEVTIVNNVGDVEYTLEWISNENQCSDAYEPNDSCDTAVALSAGLVESLNVCVDADYYKIHLSPFQRLKVTATYNPSLAAGEMDIFLFGPDDCLRLIDSGTEGPGSTPDTVADTLEYQASRGGDYYLLTSIFQGLHVPYTLNVEIEDGPACEDDGLHNLTVEDAHVLARESVLDQTKSALLGMKVCDASSDWFAIDLEEDDEIKWVVNFRHTAGDINAELIGPDKVTVLASSTSEEDFEELIHTVEAGAAGRYYLRVFGAYAVRTEYNLLTYLNGVGPELPACPDRFGANDSFEKAAEIEQGSFSDLVVCGNPRFPKWFKTSVKSGETIDVKINYLQANGRLTLRLHDENRGVLAQSLNNSNTQQVSYLATQDMDVYILIEMVQNRPWNHYDMTVAIHGAEACIDDRFQGGNASIADAVSADAPGIYTRMRICDDKTDFFAVDLEKDQKFEAFIRFVHAQADLDLRLWGPDASADDPLTAPPVVLATAAASTNNNSTESIVFTPEYTGVHYVEVLPKAAARSDYDLLLFRDVNNDGVLEGTPDRICPDALENNDSPSEAKQIAPGSYEDLSVCRFTSTTHDWDFYKLFVPAGATLSVDLDFVNDGGNIDLRVYRGTGLTQLIASSETSDDGESVTVTNTGAGEEYMFQVLAPRMATNSRNYYAMDVTLEYPDVCDDPAIAGLDKVTAKTLAPSAHENLRLCEGTEHWYKFALDSGDELVAHIDLNSRFGDVEIELLDSSGLTVASDLRSANLKSVSYDVAVTGTYYLRVFPRDGAFLRTTYDLWASVNDTEPTRPYCPDGYERNDSAEMAAPLDLKHATQSQYTDMLACGVEEDWYQVSNLIGNTDYEVAVFAQAGAALNLALKVQTMDGTVLEELPAASGDRILKFKTPAPGTGQPNTMTVLIGVVNSGAESGQGQYSLHIVRDADAYDAMRCLADAYEPNDDFATAWPLPSEAPLLLGLSACGNSDFFEWTAPASGTTSIYTLFNMERVNLGIEVENLVTEARMFRVTGAKGNLNRAGGSFEAVEGTTYLITINRARIPDTTTIADGPYFLHITQ